MRVNRAVISDPATRILVRDSVQAMFRAPSQTYRYIKSPEVRLVLEETLKSLKL
jgi:hypothetical protein